MSFAVVAGVGGAVVGGLIAADGSKSAAKTQAQAAQDANATQKQIFDEQVGLQAPFRDVGLSANNRLAFLLGLSPGQSGGQAPSSVSSPGGQPPVNGGTLVQAADGTMVPFDEQAYLSANPDVASYIQSHPPGSVGATTALQHYQTFGLKEGRTLGAPQQAAPAPQQPALSGANDIASFGALTKPFSADDFSADTAPKSQELPGYQDLPAFNPDMMKDDPGYQFRLDQGTKGLTNAYAGKGNFLSGAALKGITQYGQDYASNEYQNAFGRYQTQRSNNLQDFLTNQNTSQANRANGQQDYATAFDRYQQNRSNVINPLLSLLGAGQTATGQVSNAAQNFGNQSAATIQAAGNANAAGQVGSANAINGAFGSAANSYQNNQLMNLLRQPSTSSSLFSNTALGSSGFGTGLAFGNQDYGQYQ